MKKPSRGIIFLWVIIAGAAAAGAFLFSRHLGGAAAPAAAPAGDSNASSTVATQTFSSDGYSFNVPASWNIERTASDTIAVHPDAASPGAGCKIEVSAFAYSSGADGMADWIAHRIGADPSITVTERSSEDVSFSGGTGVKWIGTINGIPATLVYAFGGGHAYEIAPSAIGEGANGAPQCDDMLQTFLSSLTI